MLVRKPFMRLKAFHAPEFRLIAGNRGVQKAQACSICKSPFAYSYHVLETPNDGILMGLSWQRVSLIVHAYGGLCVQTDARSRQLTMVIYND